MGVTRDQLEKDRRRRRRRIVAGYMSQLAVLDSVIRDARANEMGFLAHDLTHARERVLACFRDELDRVDRGVV